MPESEYFVDREGNKWELKDGEQTSWVGKEKVVSFGLYPKFRGLKEGDDICWATGYSDFRNSYSIDKCPWDKGLVSENTRWLNGWKFAESEIKK